LCQLPVQAAASGLTLSINNSALVLSGTQTGLSYEILTNSAPGQPWGVWQTFTASSSSSSFSPLPVTGSTIFFKAQSVVTPGFPLSQYITNGLAAWWRLNDASGSVALDSSGNGLTLQLINGPSWETGDLLLNGDDQYGDAGSNALANLDYLDRTVCAWIYPNGLNAFGNSGQSIIDKSFDAGGGLLGGWQVLMTNNQPAFAVPGSIIIDNNGDIVPPGQWVFITVVWHTTTDTAEFYVNGHLDAVGTRGSINSRQSFYAHLLVGNAMNDIGGGVDSFNGALRDVAVYGRALSAAEVETNFVNSYASVQPIPPKPDLLYYTMTTGTTSDATPQTLPDNSSAGAATGTILGPYVLWTNGVGGAADTAVHFNGVGDYVSVSDPSQFDFTTNAFTINVWLLPYTGSGALMGNSTYQQSGWFLALNSDHIEFGSENPGVENILGTAEPIQHWPWDGSTSDYPYSMITITRQAGSQPLIYVNGLPVLTTGSFQSPTSTTNMLIYGMGTNTAGSTPYDGNMWISQIWSQTLTGPAVLNLYSNQISGQAWP
jgi:hypothetical protein